MSELDEMRVFVTLVENNSSTKAAEKMGLANSAISRRMKDLETRLGVQLVQRTTRRMHLTEDGKFFYARCKRLLEDLHEAESMVSHSAKELSGKIKISTPLSFGVAHLAPAIAAFMHLHEKIEIELDMTDRRVDLVEEGFDLALRISQLDDSSLQARKLAPIKHLVCCSPAFLSRYGPFTEFEQLADVPALCYTNSKQPNRWIYKDQTGQSGFVKVVPKLSSTNGDALCEAAVAGIGVVCEPTFILHSALEKGLLVPLFAQVKWYDMSLYALYPQTRHLSSKVRALIDFLAERFGDQPYWDKCTKP